MTVLVLEQKSGRRLTQELDPRNAYVIEMIAKGSRLEEMKGRDFTWEVTNALAKWLAR